MMEATRALIELRRDSTDSVDVIARLESIRRSLEDAWHWASVTAIYARSDAEDAARGIISAPARGAS